MPTYIVEIDVSKIATKEGKPTNANQVKITQHIEANSIQEAIDILAQKFPEIVKE